MMHEYNIHCAHCGDLIGACDGCAEFGRDCPGASVVVNGVEVHRACAGDCGRSWVDMVVADAMSEVDAELAFLLGAP